MSQVRLWFDNVLIVIIWIQGVTHPSNNLESAYDLISKQAFNFFKTGDEEKYNFLQTFKTMSPKLDPNDVPDPKAFREQINALGEKELEKLRKEFVKHLLNTPNSDILLIFSLTKLAGSWEEFLCYWL